MRTQTPMNVQMNMMIAVVVLVGSITMVAFARADESFQQKHPRRAEVNRRERNEQRKINKGVDSGKLTPQQAGQLEQKSASIKQQERQDVKANGGYLTKGQQKQLNHEENQENRQIAKDEHPMGTTPVTTGQ